MDFPQINQANPLGSALAGYDAGQKIQANQALLEQSRLENNRKHALSEARRISYSGDPRASEAIQLLASLDPDEGKKAVEWHKERSQRLGAYMKTIDMQPETTKAKVYDYVTSQINSGADPFFSADDLKRAGLPDKWSSDLAPKISTLSQMHRDLENVNKAPKESADLEATKASTAKTYADINKTRVETQQLKDSDGIKPEDRFKNTTALRNDYMNNSKTFQGVKEGYERVTSSAENPTPAGDLSLIFGYMKALDPNSTVRESEFAAAAKAGNFGDKIQNAVSRVTSGERLSSNQRKDFVNRSSMLYKQAEKSQQKIVDQYTGIAKRNKLNPDDVIIDYKTTVPQTPQMSEILPQFKDVSLDAIQAEIARRRGAK